MAIDSALWMTVGRVAGLAISWAVSIVLANYLGSEAFGALSYSTALVGLMASVVTAGLSGVVVKDLVKNKDEQPHIMGTVFAMRLIAACIAMVVLLLLSWVFRIGPAEAALFTTIIGIGLFFRGSEVIDFWYQSNTQQRYVAIATFISVAGSALAKVVLVVLDAPTVAFAWAVLLEAVLLGVALLAVYWKHGGKVNTWAFELVRSVRYLKRTWPLLLSGLANAINLRIDQVLLGAITGASAVGTYAVAARLSEVWYFIPTAVASAVFPSLIRAKERSDDLYRSRLRKLYAAFAWSAISVAVVMTLVAHPLIETLYSTEYSGAADILVIHVWTAPFLFMGVVFSKWLVAEELLIMSLVRHSLGAALNIVLNLILIPSHGATGAALATLISYATATYLACFFNRKTWPVAADMTRGLLAPAFLAATGIKYALRRVTP